MDIRGVWANIFKDCQALVRNNVAFGLRLRYNPHHPKEQRDTELAIHRSKAQNDWNSIKTRYMHHRDAIVELVSASDNEDHKDMLKTLEKVFTNEFEKAMGLEVEEE